MISPSAYLFRLRRRLEHGSHKPNARDLELLRAAAAGRLVVDEDFDAQTFEYKLDGEVIDKKPVRRVAYYLGLISTPLRDDLFSKPERVRAFEPSASGLKLLDPVTEGNPHPLLVTDTIDGPGDSWSATMAALCRSENGERFLVDYEHGALSLSNVVIRLHRDRSFKNWECDFKVWMNATGAGKPKVMRLNVRGLRTLWTVPNEDGTPTASETLRQTAYIVHDAWFASQPAYAEQTAQLRAMIGDGPMPASKPLIDALRDTSTPFKLAGYKQAKPLPAAA